MHKAAAHLLGLFSVAFAALFRPGPAVRWLGGRFPDVLFQQADAGPVVALSFDDSPHATLTPRILDVLAGHGARATFFVIGDRVDGNEDVVRRMVAEGHELGNHMMSDAPSVRLPAAEFERQLLQTHALLAPFGPVRWFRPGHGRFNRRMLDQIHRHGYRCALASAYALEFLAIPAPYAARHILIYVRPGGVIVLHDGAAERDRTVAVLEQVLPALRRRGYRIVTLSELAATNRPPLQEPRRQRGLRGGRSPSDRARMSAGRSFRRADQATFVPRVTLRGAGPRSCPGLVTASGRSEPPGPSRG